ncbi:MAG: helix-turn-helix domain-containing protein [Geobacteraceae bacterium]|nr:helix-turn-helix domain-containing protein [Geobacteraceae bacterium]
MIEYNIGKKLKKLRLSKKMTLKDIAERVGCSIALMSQVENGYVSPPIATLSKLSKILNFKLSSLFDHEEEERYEIVRKEQQKYFSRFIPLRSRKYPHYHEPFFRKMPNKKMVPYLINLSGDTFNTSSYSHEGESFIYVMKGQFELFLGSQLFVLNEGDSIYFDTSLSHRYQCREGFQATILELRSVI